MPRLVELDSFPNATNVDFAGELAVASKVRFGGGVPWFDVTHRAFGADPTGAQDSTAAIQAALNAANAALGA